MKKLLNNFIVLSLFCLAGCGKASIETSSVNQIDTSITESVSSQSEFNPQDFVNDEFANGTHYENGINQNRIIDDPLYQQIMNQKELLKVGETYIEDFDKDFALSRIYVTSVDPDVSYQIKSSGNSSIDHNSLYFSSKGNYYGVNLGGMKFAKYGSYTVEFDYKIISASNDFFLQFQSPLGGVSSYKYSTINGNDGDSGHNIFEVNLEGYNDYFIHLFPRDNAGAISFDNIKITRNNSKPVVLGGKIEFADNRANLSYDYYDSENDSESNSQIKWFTALNSSGVDKEYLAENVLSISTDESMNGKFLGVDIVPKSVGEGSNSIGANVTILSKTTFGAEPKTLKNLLLAENEEFIEDFEDDFNCENNIYFQNNSTMSLVYLTTEALSGNKSLHFVSDGSFMGANFSGIKFVAKGIYQIEFDYKFLVKGSNFYVQLRSETGYTASDVFSSFDMSSIQVNELYHFTGEFRLMDYTDYFLMMFPSALGCELIIDNLKIARKEGYNSVVVDRELAVGEKISENFNDMANLSIGIDTAQCPNSKFVYQGIDQGSLYVESEGNFKCLFINRGIKYSPNATYKVSFDYKVTDFVDTLYLQFNNGSKTLYAQFGSFETVGTVSHFEYEFTIDESINYVIQIFPGSSVGNTKLYIDNLEIERIG